MNKTDFVNADHVKNTSACLQPLHMQQATNLETFAAFIDFQKAFDYVDWDLLMFSLLKNKVMLSSVIV